MRLFGCACYLLLRPYSSHKLLFQSKKYIFLGYSSNQRGYRCLDPTSQKIIISRHVIFDELTFPGKNSSSLALLISTSTMVSSHGKSSSIPFPSLINYDTISFSSQFNSLTTTYTQLPSSQSQSEFSPTLPPNFSPLLLEISPQILSLSKPTSITPQLSQSPSLITHPMTIRSQTINLKPHDFSDYQTLYSTKHHLKALTSVRIPSKPNFNKQVSLLFEWCKAMQEKYDALIAN